MIFRGAYASLRGVGFAYGDFFCFQLWNEALETQATSIQLAKAKSMSSNCCQRASTVYTKPTRCRLKQAYADANRLHGSLRLWHNMPRGVPIYLLFCIQKKNATQLNLCKLLQTEMSSVDRKGARGAPRPRLASVLILGL